MEKKGATRVVFSLDLKAGQALGDVRPWPEPSPFEIAAHAARECGVRRMIVAGSGPRRCRDRHRNGAALARVSSKRFRNW